MNPLSAAAQRGLRTGRLARHLRPGRVPLLSELIYRLYWLSPWRLQAAWRWLLYRLEGGCLFSLTLRRICRRQFGVDVGLYTQGDWYFPFHLDEHTTVGRYCSIASTARVVTQNHPTSAISTSALFYQPSKGLVRDNPVPANPVAIGSDVWIGHHAVVIPPTRAIGHGAVIGAGAIVTRDVPPYAIVMGNPARVIGYRFPPERIAELLASRWWERSLEELLPDLESFCNPPADARKEAIGSAAQP
jgi:acetyltransferase-like isoleucine patch superfamily enzyme